MSFAYRLSGWTAFILGTAIVVTPLGQAHAQPSSGMIEQDRVGLGSANATARTWSRESEHDRNIYALALADALLGGHGTHQRRTQFANSFRQCMDVMGIQSEASTPIGRMANRCLELNSEYVRE